MNVHTCKMSGLSKPAHAVQIDFLATRCEPNHPPNRLLKMALQSSKQSLPCSNPLNTFPIFNAKVSSYKIASAY